MEFILNINFHTFNLQRSFVSMFLKVCPRLFGDETKVLDSSLMHKSAEICQSSWAKRTCIAWSWCCSSFPRCSYKDEYLESKLPKCYSRNSHMALTKEWLHALLANPAAVSSVTRIQDFPSLCSFRFYPNFDGMLTFLEFSYASPHMFTQLSRFARFLAASFTHHGRLRLAAGLFIPFGGQYFSSSCARKEVLPCCRAWIPARRSEGTYRASCEESNVWLGSARLHDGWPHSTKMKKPSVW